MGVAAAASAAAVTLDAPGHAAREGDPVAMRDGEPGAAWSIVDWRDRAVDGAAGAFDDNGCAELPALPPGYYRIVGGNPARRDGLATLAVVAGGGARHDAAHTAIDAALSSISRRGAFPCPWNGGDTERTVADLLDLAGFTLVRDRLWWGEVQPKPGTEPRFSRPLGNAELLARRGARISGMFHDAPTWTHPSPKLPRDLDALHRFCAEAAAAFGDRAGDWEFWNEPDIHCAPEPVWEYAAALKTAYLGFKSSRPDLPVLNGALCLMPQRSRYLEVMLDNDAALYFDAFNHHWYAPPSTYPEFFSTIRSRLEEAGAADCPIWITEFGTELEGHAQAQSATERRKEHSPGQERVLAEFYPKAHIAFMMEGVERAFFFVFGVRNERGGSKDFGVLRRNGTAKPIFSAMATMNRQLGGKRLVGRMDAPPGIRAFLFEPDPGDADGADATGQTVVFWSESPMDTATGGQVVESSPDFAREWRLSFASGYALNSAGGAAPGPLRLFDTCGMEMPPPAAAPDGALVLAASRFPSYLTGLHGLRAVQPPHPIGDQDSLARQGDIDPSIVIRPILDRLDFSIGSNKTLASLDADTGRLAVEVWNFSDSAKTGTISATGCPIAGIPSDSFVIGPRGSGPVCFDCALEAGDAASGEYSAALRLSGNFNGREISRAAVPLFFAKRFLETCVRVPLAWRDPAKWTRNTSAPEFSASWDEREKAVRFDVAWKDTASNRWFYPILELALPEESLAGARRIVFEVRSEQDKVENDFVSQNVMLVFANGSAHYLQYEAPTTEWERRHVDLPADQDLSRVTAIRIGANPIGTRCSFWVRNIEVLK